MSVNLFATRQFAQAVGVMIPRPMEPWICSSTNGIDRIGGNAKAPTLTSLEDLREVLPAKLVGNALWRSDNGKVSFDKARAGVIGDFLCRELRDNDDPMGPILNWQSTRGLSDKPQRKLMDPLVKSVRSFLRKRGVSAKRVGVSYDRNNGLMLDYKIKASIKEKDRIRILSALVALSQTSFSLLSWENERGYPVRFIGPYRMVKIPAGVFVRGAADLHRAIQDCPPSWVELTEDYWIAETAAMEGLYRLFGIEGGCRYAPPNHPATDVRWYEAIKHIFAVNKYFGTDICLPTETQSERAMRGPWVNIIEQMKEEGISITHEEFIDFVAGRYENFVIANGVEDITRGLNIYTDPRDPRIAENIETGTAFLSGLRKFGTISGMLRYKEAWYSRTKLNAASWGLSNAWGLKGTCGGVLEWVQDWYDEKAYELEDTDPEGPTKEGGSRVLRGGSLIGSSSDLCAAFRLDAPPNSSDFNYGFRVAAPA